MSLDPFERLHRIAQLLARPRQQPPNRGDRDPTDSAALHLGEVPSDRIRELTALLQQPSLDSIDEIDAVAIRLLLSDYSRAVAHLRAVAQSAVAQIDAAAVPVGKGQKFLRLEEHREKKRTHRRTIGASRAPAGGPLKQVRD